MNYIKIIRLEGEYDLELWSESDDQRENDRFIIAKRDLSGSEILKYTELLLGLQD